MPTKIFTHLGPVCLVFLLSPIKLKCLSGYMLFVCRRINDCLFCVLNKMTELENYSYTILFKISVELEVKKLEGKYVKVG